MNRLRPKERLYYTVHEGQLLLELRQPPALPVCLRLHTMQDTGVLNASQEIDST